MISFEFFADELVTFECSVLGNPFIPCTSPYTTSTSSMPSMVGLVFRVRPTDLAGNVGILAERPFYIENRDER
jgi:hypothetical protein